MTEPELWEYSTFDDRNLFPGVFIKQSEAGDLVGLVRRGSPISGPPQYMGNFIPLDEAIAQAYDGGKNGPVVHLVVAAGVDLTERYKTHRPVITHSLSQQ